MKQQGKYVLVLKFSEVYFNSPGEKVFDAGLGSLKVISSLDIYSKVGKATAYDEYVEFEFKNGKVYVEVKNQIFFSFVKYNKKHKMFFWSYWILCSIMND